MTNKGFGNAKTEVIRIHPDVKTDLNFIKREIGMSSKDSEGDVVHQLVAMYKGQKIGKESISGVQSVNDPELQLTLDHYKDMYDEQLRLTQNWMARFRIACDKGNLDPREIIVLVT